MQNRRLNRKLVKIVIVTAATIQCKTHPNPAGMPPLSQLYCTFLQGFAGKIHHKEFSSRAYRHLSQQSKTDSGQWEDKGSRIGEAAHNPQAEGSDSTLHSGGSDPVKLLWGRSLMTSTRGRQLCRSGQEQKHDEGDGGGANRSARRGRDLIRDHRDISSVRLFYSHLLQVFED